MSMGDPFTAMIMTQLASQGINAGMQALRPDQATGFAMNDPAGQARMQQQRMMMPPQQTQMESFAPQPQTGLDIGQFLMALAQMRGGGGPRG